MFIAVATTQSMRHQTPTSLLTCRLQRSGRVPYEQYRVEFLHRSPDVVIFHNFVTDREASALRHMAASKVCLTKP